MCLQGFFFFFFNFTFLSFLFFLSLKFLYPEGSPNMVEKVFPTQNPAKDAAYSK